MIIGNIEVANPDSNKPKGLIGNNFPDPDENGNIKFDEIRKMVFCKKCFSEILHRPDKPVIRTKDETVLTYLEKDMLNR